MSANINFEEFEGSYDKTLSGLLPDNLGKIPIKRSDCCPDSQSREVCYNQSIGSELKHEDIRCQQQRLPFRWTGVMTQERSI